MLSQPPTERDQALDRLDAHLVDFLSDSRESALFTPSERRELEKEADAARQHCQELLVNMETGRVTVEMEDQSKGKKHVIVPV